MVTQNLPSRFGGQERDLSGITQTDKPKVAEGATEARRTNLNRIQGDPWCHVTPRWNFLLMMALVIL